MKHLIRCGFAAALLSLSPATFATDFMDVYNDALNSDPVLGAAIAGHRAAKEVYPQARAPLLPSIQSSGFLNRNRREFPELPTSGPSAPPGTPPALQNEFQPVQGNPEFFSSRGYQIQLRQPIINSELWMRLRSARSRTNAADFDLSAAETEVIVRVVQAYLDVLRAQDQLESTSAEETAVRRQLEQVQQRFEVGLVAITDVLESQAAYDDTVVRRIQADRDQDIFFETLSTLTGRTYDALDRVSQELPIIDPNPIDEDAWVAAAMRSNPAILAAEQQLKAAQRTTLAARTSRLPTLDAVVTQSRFINGSFNFFGVEITDQTVWGLELNFPVYAGGILRSQTREARALSDQALQQLTSQQFTVTRDTRNLYRAVATDVVRVRARLKAIASAQSALEATETGYEVGTRNIVDVLQAQQALYRSQFDYADSRYAYIMDLMRLKQNAGYLLQQDLEELNKFTDANDPVKRLVSLRSRSANFAAQ